MKCFYHNDADGRCAGFWVFHNAGLTNCLDVCEFIEMSYEKPFPIDTIRPNEQIYIVDYSISPDEMRELLKITPDVTWIDHHKTAIEKYEGFEHDIRGVRIDGIAGCMLTYCYLHHMTEYGLGDIKPFDISMVRKAPLFTRLIADWDVWKFEYGNNTRRFITAFNAYDFSPRSCEWWDFFQGYMGEAEERMIEEGEIMIRYRDGWAKECLKRFGFETEFEGLKCFAVNLGNCNSEYFKSLPEGKYDAFMPFAFNGELYTVSMYSEAVDISGICKKYGGGGHAGAAGFQCKELPFKKGETNA
jgi:oligoribonuclease NrnB/cAMP/cGMP phosphodiesterase (DHH superfamily)